MRLGFTKMSGAGNDFIVVDNRDGSLNGVLSEHLISTLCTRGLWIGADGLLELRGHSSLPFAMKYYNSDGRPASMCGNGGRCIARYAASTGLVEPGAPFTFSSDAGIHRALVTGDHESRIWLTEPVVHYLDREIEAGGLKLRISYLDTGVPHAVLVTAGPNEPPFSDIAPLIRSHSGFGTAGANADYLWLENGRFHMRTWERGVEGETLACGTGAVACAICAVELLGARLPADIVASSGLTLITGHDEHGWWLQGEAREVYSGILDDLPQKNLTETR